MRKAIKNVGKGIEECATPGYIGHKRSGGRQFAYIRVHRTSLQIGAHLIDEKRQLLGYDGTRVESSNEDYGPTLEEIKAAFVALGGHLA